MSSSIYNHKHLQPTGASTQPGPGGPSSSQQQQLNAHRLNDFFEPIRQEFDVLAQDIAVLRGQRDEFENKVTSQVNELNIIRQSLYDLETQHTKIRTQYEDEIRSLRSEILALRTARDGPPPPREGIASLGRGTLNERDREAVGLGPPSSMPPSIPPSSSIPPNPSSLLNNVTPGGRAPGDALGLPGATGRPNSDSLVPVAGPVGLGVGSGPGGGGGGVVVSGPGGPGMGPGGGMTGVMGPGGPGVYPPSGSANPAEGFYRGAVDRDRDRLDSISATRDRERERDLRDGRDLRDRDRDRDRERERDLGVGRDRDRMESRERGDRDRLLSSADSRERDRDIIMRDVRGVGAGAGDVRDIRDIRTADDRQREMMAMALSRGGAERDIRDMRDVRDIRDIRDRELRGERDVRGERDRDVLMRDAIRDLPPSAGGPSSGRDLRGERDFPGGRERDGMRDRDLRDRERDRDRDREGRDRDRDGREGREVKRIKTEGGPNAGKGGAKNDPYSSPLLQTSQNSLALGPPPHPSQPGSIALGPPPGGRDAVMRDAREPSIRENGTSSSAPSQTPKLPPAPGPPYPSQTQGNQPPPPGREPGGGAPQTPNIHSMGTNGPHPQTPTGPGMGIPPPSTPTAASGEYPPTAYPPTSGPGGNGPPPSSSAQQAAPVAPNSGGGAPPQPSPSIQPSSASAVGASGGVGAAPGGSGGAGQQQLIYPQPGPGGIIDLSLDPHTVPSELKKEGSDWYAVFNPNLPSGGGAGKEGGKESGSVVGGKEGRRLDVSLVHTLMHERFSADGKFLATGCNRTAQIYDTKTGAKTCVLVDEEASKTGDLYIRSVCFSPDGKYLATGAEDKQIRIWDIAKRKIRNVFEGHQQEIYSLDFSRDGRLIVSGSGDRTARIWDMADGSTNKILTINEPDSIDAGVTSVCISPDGRLVAAGSLDTIVRIWDVQTGTLVERLKGHRDSVYSVAFTPDGRGLVSGSLDKTLKYWDVRPILRRDGSGGPQGSGIVGGAAAGSSKNGKEGGEKGSQCTMNFVGHKDYVLSVAVSHDGQWVVSGSKDRGVQFWDAKTAVVQCMLQGHKNSVISIDLSPAASLLATGSGDWQARIWSYQAL